MHRRFLLVLFVTAAAFAQQPLRFEVASVKPNEVGSGLIRLSKDESPTRIVYRNISLRHLILDEAFGLTEYQLKGPEWLSHDWFDIEVLKPAGTTKAQASLMMQTLLTERFHMRSHFEDTRMSGYVLLAGKDREKLHPALDGERVSGCPVGTMDDYARQIQNVLQRPVVNETGVSGLFRLRLIVMMAQLSTGNVPEGTPVPPPPAVPPPPNVSGCPGWDPSEKLSAALSAEEAVSEQMGLVLRKAPDATVRVLVIDHIDRDATPN
jgi:uncharacterized protein (TIGR03435 family)